MDTDKKITSLSVKIKNEKIEAITSHFSNKQNTEMPDAELIH